MTTTQDFDRLSAYLDDQLPARDRAALEARLAAEPELRAALSDLRLTVRALRSLPVVKPPRSFVLTPAQVGAAGYSAPRRAPLFPLLRLATGLSAVALAVVLVGDLGGGFLAASVSQDAQSAGGEAEVALVTVTDTVEEAAPAEAPVPSETPPTDADVMAGAGEGDAGTDDGAETNEAAELTPEMSLLAPEAAVTATPTGPADRTAAPTAEPSPKSLEPTSTPLAVADAPPNETDDLYYSTDTSTAETQTVPPERGLDPLRVLELSLVMLTVLLGAAAFFARRNG